MFKYILYNLQYVYSRSKIKWKVLTQKITENTKYKGNGHNFGVTLCLAIKGDKKKF